jgi:hypothetical protein
MAVQDAIGEARGNGVTWRTRNLGTWEYDLHLVIHTFRRAPFGRRFSVPTHVLSIKEVNLQLETAFASLKPSSFCWICGRAISPDDHEADNHGHAVHGRCYTIRRQLQVATALAAASKVASAA